MAEDKKTQRPTMASTAQTKPLVLDVNSASTRIDNSNVITGSNKNSRQTSQPTPKKQGK